MLLSPVKRISLKSLPPYHVLYQVTQIIKFDPEFLFTNIRRRAIYTGEPPRNPESQFEILMGREYNPCSIARISSKSVFHPMNIPPAVPSAGEDTQSIFLSPQEERKQRLSIFAFGFLKHKVGLVFLKDLFDGEVFTGVPNPLTFHEIIFIQ